MSLQYVARRSSTSPEDEAFPSQTRMTGFFQCILCHCSDNLQRGCTQATIPSYDWGQAIPAGTLNSKRDRRNRCRTVLKAFSRFASLPLSPRAAVAVRLKKNSWSSSPSPSRWNRPTPASTSKPRDCGGRAFAPARIFSRPLLAETHHFAGGVPC